MARNKQEMSACSYNLFMEALEELKAQRPDSKAIEELYSVLSMMEDDWGTFKEKEFIGTKKQINKYLNDSKPRAKRAFSKLSREELGALINYIEREFKRSFDRNQIINEYIEELRKHCKEPSKTNDYDYDHGIDNSWGDDDWGFTNQDGLDSTYGDPFAASSTYRNSSRRNRPGISISNPFAGLAADRKREKLPLCTYDQFMDVLETARSQSPDSATLSNLFYALDLKDRSDYIGSRNQINSYLNRSKEYLRRAFNKLTREEMYSLRFNVEQTYKRRLDKKEIIDEYMEKLKQFCKEPTKQKSSSYRSGYSGGYDYGSYDYDYSYDEPLPSVSSYDEDQTRLTPVDTGRRQRRNMAACTYDTFFAAVEELRAQRPNSPGISNLYYSLGTEGRIFTGSRNQINSLITHSISSVRRAFNKLSREEMGALISLVENKYNRRFDKGAIVAGFTTKLKEQNRLNSVAQGHGNYDYQGTGFVSSSYPLEETPDYAHGFSVSTGRKFKSVGPTGQFVATRKEYNPYMDRVTALQIPKDYKYKYSYIISQTYGESVIGFIDRLFNKQILGKFDEELIQINPFDPNYIQESNKLIEAIVEDALLYDTEEAKKKMIAAVKDNYGLEFSLGKRPEEVLKELISDELRFYQQKIIERKLNSMDTTSLGTSKRISKDIWEQRMVLEDLRTFTLPSYAFTEEVIDNYPIDIVTSRKQLPKDYASRYLTGGSFGAQTAQVIITKGSDGTYRVSNALGKILQ